jgi:hypothetical protein
VRPGADAGSHRPGRRARGPSSFNGRNVDGDRTQGTNGSFDVQPGAILAARARSRPGRPAMRRTLAFSLAVALPAVAALPAALSGCSVACGCSPIRYPTGRVEVVVDGQPLTTRSLFGHAAGPDLRVGGLFSDNRRVEVYVDAHAPGTYTLGSGSRHTATWSPVPGVYYTTEGAGGAGTVVIASAGDERAAGTFDFRAVLPGPTGADTIRVTGTFEVDEGP